MIDLTRPSRILAFLALMSGGAGTAGAVYHLRLEKSTPAKDERLTASPAEVRLWFTEKPEVRVSAISIVGSDSTELKLEKARTTDEPNSIVATLPKPLVAGSYLVRWRTAGRDGHVLRGSYPFSIAR